MDGNVSPSTPEIRLVYFDIRGFAEPLRWMLKIAHQDFVDERIPLDAWRSGRKRSSSTPPRDGERMQSMIFTNRQDRESSPKEEGKRKRSSDSTAAVQWRFRKFVGQLPVLYYGETFVLTQTLAVMRYLARKLGMNGETQMDEARADEVADLVYDLRLRAVDYEGIAFKSPTPDIVRHTVFRDLANAPESDAKEKMKEYFRTIYFPLYFNKFASLLEKSGGVYVAGNKLTYGDLVLVNFIQVVEDLVDPNCLDEFPKLKAHKERILEIPELKEWFVEQSLKTKEKAS